MSTPDVSVVVRSIGRPTLDRALDSIARQRGIDAEVVLVAASGPSHPPVRAAAGVHALRVVASSAPLDRPAAINAGLDAARGRYVTWLDDDDEFLDGHLAALLAAADASPGARVVHSLAEVRLEGEPSRTFGHPLAPSEFYRENCIHPSTALVDMALVRKGCRADPALKLHQDWDWLLQCLQHTAFRFVRQRSFVWYAGIGGSGSGGGSNVDASRSRAFDLLITDKWRDASTRHEAAWAPPLAAARTAMTRGDLEAAAESARRVLAIDYNNPDALDVIARAASARGRLDDAETAAALASLVRPDDAALVYNLALVCRARGETGKVAALAARLRRIGDRDARAAAFIERLDGS